MLLVTSNKSKQLLQVRYLGRVRLEDLQRTRENFLEQMRELSPGFTLFGDFSQLETMDADCAPEIGRNMELLAEAGVGMVIRVMPDATKDIGMNILTAFHYRKLPRIVTFKTLAEALELLNV